MVNWLVGKINVYQGIIRNLKVLVIMLILGLVRNGVSRGNLYGPILKIKQRKMHSQPHGLGRGAADCGIFLSRTWQRSGGGAAAAAGGGPGPAILLDQDHPSPPLPPPPPLACCSI